MSKMICFLEELWNDIRFMPSAPISGHRYESPDKREVILDHVIIIDYCTRCGEPSFSHCTREMYEKMKAEGSL